MGGAWNLLLRSSVCFKEFWEFPVDDFLVLARPQVAGLYILSPSARLIWDILKTGLPVPELIREFASICDIPPEIAAQDVTRTLDDWQSDLLSRSRELSSQIAAPTKVPASSSVDFFARDYLVQGKNVRLILQTSELAEEIAPRLESLPHAPSAPDFTFRVVEDPDGFRIFCDERYVGSEEGITAARGALLQEIVRSCRGQDCLAIFHAGACGSNSRCVVFPAGTQSGKTTLAAVLMKMGLTFYSDDSVLLERDTLSVPAMPFALMVREGSWEVLSPRFPELQDAPIVSRYGQRVRFLSPPGIKQEGHCQQVGAIVFTRFEPDAANEISTLDSLQTLLRLQESGFWTAHDEQSIGDFLTWMQSTASFALTYSDVDNAASTIRRLIV
jgi:Coenzyme PQQ synthesis protein D (PqqD)